MNPYDSLVAHTVLRRSRYRTELEQLAPALQTSWRSNARTEFPGMPLSATCFMRAAEGLLGFFAATRQCGDTCALPSLAADSVWHAWLGWDADDLAHFCRRHFQGQVPHLPTSVLTPGALARTLVTCRSLEGIAAHGLALPGLFGLDARLRVPNGHGYWLQAGEIVHGQLGQHGKPRRAARHPELTLTALLAANLINLGMYHDALEQQRIRAYEPFDIDGPDTGDGAGSDGGDGGAGSDGGGSACGGGCGGGGGD